MKTAAVHLGLLAIGWSLLAVAMAQTFLAADTALVLGTIVFAECLSRVISGLGVSPLESPSSGGQNALAVALAGWALICITLVLLFRLGQLPFFQGQPAAMLCLLALTLTLTLLKHFSVAHSFGETLYASRFIVAAGALLALNWAGGRSGILFLACLLLLHLILLLVTVFLARKRGEPVTEPSGDSALQILSTYADLLLVPMLLSGTEALMYISARCLGAAVSIVLAYLGARAMPALTHATLWHDRVQFITVAARLNLGFLLVGGGAGLASLTTGPYLASAFDLNVTGFQSVLVWVLLGACTPALFGATETLLLAMRKQDTLRVVNFGGLCIVTCTALLVIGPDVLLLAKCFAAVQVIKSGICAFTLIRDAGVWPGLTALLLRQIKLL